jgi:hypothetical protein
VPRGHVVALQLLHLNPQKIPLRAACPLFYSPHQLRSKRAEEAALAGSRAADDVNCYGVRRRGPAGIQLGPRRLLHRVRGRPRGRARPRGLPEQSQRLRVRADSLAPLDGGDRACAPPVRPPVASAGNGWRPRHGAGNPRGSPDANCVLQSLAPVPTRCRARWLHAVAATAAASSRRSVTGGPVPLGPSRRPPAKRHGGPTRRVPRCRAQPWPVSPGWVCVARDGRRGAAANGAGCREGGAGGCGEAGRVSGGEGIGGGGGGGGGPGGGRE